jgi:hypothetical protein
MKDFRARLEAMYRRFLKLSPEKQAEFSSRISAVVHSITDTELLEIFQEIEAIFKSEVKNEK